MNKWQKVPGQLFNNISQNLHYNFVFWIKQVNHYNVRFRSSIGNSTPTQNHQLLDFYTNRSTFLQRPESTAFPNRETRPIGETGEV